MKKQKINMTIIKEDIGYSAHSLVKNISINTQGDTFDEFKEMALDAVNLAFEEKGFVYGIDEISFTYDLASFFAFYKVINASALSKRLHMPQKIGRAHV